MTETSKRVWWRAVATALDLDPWEPALSRAEQVLLRSMLEAGWPADWAAFGLRFARFTGGQR